MVHSGCRASVVFLLAAGSGSLSCTAANPYGQPADVVPEKPHTEVAVAALSLGPNNTEEATAAAAALTSASAGLVHYKVVPATLSLSLQGGADLCGALERLIEDGVRAGHVPRIDEIWLHSGDQTGLDGYRACRRFAVMAYGPTTSKTPMRAFAARTADTLQHVFERTGWLNPFDQFERSCGSLHKENWGRRLCAPFRSYPLLDAQKDVEQGGYTDDAYFRQVLGFLPRSEGTFGGYENNWWKYVVTYQSADRDLRYRDLDARPDSCSAITDLQVCRSRLTRTDGACVWIGQNCFPAGTTPRDIDPKKTF